MRTAALAAVLLWGPAVLADDLVLKGDKKIEWTSLRDLGESYEVELKGGVKLEVKNSDIAKIDCITEALKYVPNCTGKAGE